MRRLLKRLLKAVAVVLTLIVVAVGMFVASLWIEHNVPLELPRPTGPFAVGRLGTSWVDTARVDPFAPPPAHDRKLGVWIWYPAQVSDGTPRPEYFPSIAQPPMAELRGAALTHFVFRSLSKVRGHSIENAELAARSQPFPVVLFNPGHGAQALQYATLVEDLAGRGYIVVGADRPYTTGVVAMPDGRVIRSSDQGSAADSLSSDGPEAELV